MVRRFVDRGLLVDSRANPDGTLHHPGQATEVCRRARQNVCPARWLHSG